MAVAAALLAIAGFWVSIAANVRQRRAENALLAALGVNQRSAAAQLFLEKLLLSVPAAALGLILGTVVARLLVPAVTLSPTAQIPVPPPVTLFDLSQTVPLAVAVAVLPALAAALVIFRRPDPAARIPSLAQSACHQPARPPWNLLHLGRRCLRCSPCSRPLPASEALATRTQAAARTIAANPPISRPSPSSTWNSVQGALTSVNSFGPPER